MKTFKKRRHIIHDEIINNTGSRIYLEKNIQQLIKKRYSKGEIKTNSSYIYRKMAVLLDQKIYLEARGIPKQYISAYGFINVFELHKKLDDIIRKDHLPYKDSKRYTAKEREYLIKYMQKNGL